MTRNRWAKRILRVSLVAATLCVAPRADAVTIEDIVGLTQAGLTDEVLIALVETDGTVFTLTPGQLVQLKNAGVSERVIVAMLRQGRTPITEQPAAADISSVPEPFPTGWQMDPGPPAPAPVIQTTVVVVPTIVPWPFFVQLPQRPIVSVPPPIGTMPFGFGRFTNTFGRFINDGFPR